MGFIFNCFDTCCCCCFSFRLRCCFCNLIKLFFCCNYLIICHFNHLIHKFFTNLVFLIFFNICIIYFFFNCIFNNKSDNSYFLSLTHTISSTDSLPFCISTIFITTNTRAIIFINWI